MDFHACRLLTPARRGRLGVRCGRAGRFAPLRASSGMVVAGDIGGTNARFQLWQIEGDERELRFQKKYPTKGHPLFLDALLEFRRDCSNDMGKNDQPTAAAFAAAGVVKAHSYCRMTNLHWELDSGEIESATGWGAVSILNDFEAVGYGILAAEDSDIFTIHEAQPVERAPKVVLGPGTGFGQAQLFWNDSIGDYTVMPSEGAHGDFGPRGTKQRELHDFIEDREGFCEVEHVCCGPGLESIYQFLAAREGAGPVAADAPAIARGALKGDDARSKEAVALLLDILGQEAGNWALRSLARGGVYIAGGITPKLLPIVRQGGLGKAFLNQGTRFSHVLESMPLKVVTSDDVGMLGSCLYASRELREM